MDVARSTEVVFALAAIAPLLGAARGADLPKATAYCSCSKCWGGPAQEPAV